MDSKIQSTSTLHKVNLSPQDHDQLIKLAQRLNVEPGARADQRLLATLRRQPLVLSSIAESLRSLAAEGISHLTLANLPIDSALPPPPANGQRPEGKTWLSETILLQLALCAGLQPMGLVEEKGGALVHEICPASGRAAEASSAGVVPLGFHTDLAILRASFRPQFLFLIGLVNESQTPTLIVDLDEALAALSAKDPGLADILRHPRFRVESPALLHLWGGKTLRSEPRPLLTPGPGGLEGIAANLDAVKPTDPEAERALAGFKAVLPGCARPIVICPGSALILNNLRTLHGRGAIAAGQRWLQRLYCRRSLAELRAATGAAPEAVIYPISRLILE
jgi:L-asparagine oxygenase